MKEIGKNIFRGVLKLKDLVIVKLRKHKEVKDSPETPKDENPENPKGMLDVKSETFFQNGYPEVTEQNQESNQSEDIEKGEMEEKREIPEERFYQVNREPPRILQPDLVNNQIGFVDQLLSDSDLEDYQVDAFN